VLEARMAASRGVNLLLTHQRADGSWAGEAVTTAQVLICLENAPVLAGDTRGTVAVVQAVNYLRRSVADTCPLAATGAPTATALEALAAAVTALARDNLATHRELLSRGRACLLASVRPLDLAKGRPEGALALGPAGFPEAATTCAALDALLVTEGLDPAWNREGYTALTAYLREALRALPRSAPAVAPGALEATLVRALLCLGVNPTESLVADALARLAQTPSTDPALAFASAEALSLARSDTATPALAPLAGWRDRLLEALLGTQQGDGGWPTTAGTGSRDRSTALALRALQVAAGWRLADSESPP
jgi:hypothetical protein